MDIWQRLESRKLVIGDCWRWSGGMSNGRQGQVWYRGRTVTVSRLIMHLTTDFNLDSEDFILHKLECKFTDCWNPQHLYVGDHMQNMIDREEARTHCLRGHEFTVENTGFDSRQRFCKECRRASWKAFRQRE